MPSTRYLPEMSQRASGWIKIGLCAVVLTLAHSRACGYVPENLWALTHYYAEGFGIDPYLLGALLWVESSFCSDAQGAAGELGLSQFMPRTFEAATGAPAEWRSDPAWAIYAAARHLRTLYDSFGELELALAAYNAGSARVRRGEIPASTRRYVARVLEVYWAWRNQ